MTTAEIQRMLADPFLPDEVQWKPQLVRDERALAIAYIDARLVCDRLDAVLGIANWQDEYEFLNDGTVLCRLSLHIEGDWLAKCDVGAPSEQPDAGDRRKAAVSDALKRAAIKWGIGRYLYSLEGEWVGYDSKTRRLKEIPGLPAWALPRPISKEQHKELFDLLEKGEADIDRFRQAFGINDLARLPAQRYEEAKGLALAKIERKKIA